MNIDEVLQRFTTLPRKGTPAADLTERDKLALCIAAGAPFVTEMVGMVLTVRTTVPCGVADRGDGGYLVGIGPATHESALTKAAPQGPTPAGSDTAETAPRSCAR